jgi:DHA2 family multidrug resistance protein
MLDRGSQRDWFQSTEILVEAGLALGTFWMFVVHTITTPHPLLSLALFRDRNFVIAVIFTMMISGVMMAGSALMAPLLQVLMGYDAKGAGFLMMPRGLGIFVAMPLAAFVSKRIDPRILIAFGLMLTATSLWIMTGFDLEMGKEWMIYSGLVQGAGMGFAFLPLNVLAFSTLPGHLRTEGASLYNLARSVGGSVTISLMGALLSRNVQVSHADLGAHITSTSLPFIESGIIEQLGVRGNLVTRMIDTEINRQALMVAYLDDFWVMQWTALLLLPLVLFMRRGERTSEAPSIHLE